MALIDMIAKGGRPDNDPSMGQISMGLEELALKKEALGLRKSENAAMLESLAIKREGLAPKPTNAQKQYDELVSRDMNPHIAEGIAYGTYVPVTGDDGTVRMFDKRNMDAGPMSPDETAALPQEAWPQQSESKSDKRGKVVSKGTKIERENIKIMNTGIKGIKNDLSDQGDLGGLDASLTAVEEAINKIPDGDIPGYGQTTMAPDMLLSQSGKNMRSTLSGFFNRLLKLRSGAAVTDPELNRLIDEVGAGDWVSDERLRHGLKLARQHLNKSISNIAAGYPKEVVTEWDSRSSRLGNTRIGNRAPVSNKRKRLEELRRKAKGKK